MLKAQIKLDTRPLDNLKNGLQRRLIRIAMNAASSPVRDSIRQNMPEDTGALKKSVAIKVKQSRKSKNWYSVIGTKKKFVYKKRHPGRYAGLVNLGTKKRPGVFYLQTALKTSKTVFLTRFTAKLKQLIASLKNKG